MRLVTLVIFTTCYLSAALATPNLNFAAIALAEEAPFHLNYSPMDLDYAKDITLLTSELSKNQLKKKTVDNLAKYQDKAHAFSILNSTYDRLKLILAIEDLDSFCKYKF